MAAFVLGSRVVWAERRQLGRWSAGRLQSGSSVCRNGNDGRGEGLGLGHSINPGRTERGRDQGGEAGCAVTDSQRLDLAGRVEVVDGRAAADEVSGRRLLLVGASPWAGPAGGGPPSNKQALLVSSSIP